MNKTKHLLHLNSTRPRVRFHDGRSNGAPALIALEKPVDSAVLTVTFITSLFGFRLRFDTAAVAIHDEVMHASVLARSRRSTRCILTDDTA